MVSLGEILAANFPHLIPLRDYEVRDKGDGAELVFWDESKASRPSATELDAMQLPYAKNIKWQHIQASRDTAEFGPFEYAGMVFDGNAISKQRINGAVTACLIAQMAGQPYTEDWTLADNSVVTLNIEQIIGVGMAAADAVKDAHARGRLLRAQIDDADDIEELESINW